MELGHEPLNTNSTGRLGWLFIMLPVWRFDKFE